jgi:tetratricopeptide (TPR) repeat protein
MMMRRFSILVAVVLALSVASPARGEDKGAAARALYVKGTAAYNVGEFGEAIEKFKAAYRLRPEPALLYNIAQSYRHLKEYSQALFSYRSYLRSAAPNAPNRTEAEAHIKELEAIVAQAKGAAIPSGASTPPAAATTSTTAEPPPSKNETPKSPPTTASSSTRLANNDSPSSSSSSSSSLTKAPEPAAEPPTLIKRADATTPSPASSPIYTRWWFWAGAGAIIAGGVVTAILLTSKSDAGGTKVFCTNDPTCGH